MCNFTQCGVFDTLIIHLKILPRWFSGLPFQSPLGGGVQGSHPGVFVSIKPGFFLIRKTKTNKQTTPPQKKPTA